jgi:hypothetical protein
VSTGEEKEIRSEYRGEGNRANAEEFKLNFKKLKCI